MMAPNHETDDDSETEQMTSAHISVFVDPSPDARGYPMVVPTADDVGFDDLGELVPDRIEANGRVTMPDSDDLPEPGERQRLGFVHWDAETGIPTRLDLGDREVHFTESGGVDHVEEV